MKFSALQLILSRHKQEDIKALAKREGVSVITLIRNAIEEYLSSRTVHMRLGGKTVILRLKKANPDEPEVSWTADEQKYADEAMKIFLEEDR